MQQDENKISSKKVVLRPLAAPDVLEFNLPENHICIITDDGSQISVELAERLYKRGWNVVALRYHWQDGYNLEGAVDIPFGFDKAALITMTSADEVHIQKQLDDIISRFGQVAAFIHVHPKFQSNKDKDVTFSVVSESILHQVFLIAKYLQPSLTTAAELPVSGTRASFMTVTQLDGGFGMLGEDDIDVVAGGLSGLTKTLALEWPNVFCRAVDVSPDAGIQAVDYIMAELNDPNRCRVEVGWHHMHRLTPEVG